MGGGGEAALLVPRVPGDQPLRHPLYVAPQTRDALADEQQHYQPGNI